MTLLSKWDDRPLFKRNTKYFIGRVRNNTGWVWSNKWRKKKTNSEEFGRNNCRLQMLEDATFKKWIHACRTHSDQQKTCRFTKEKMETNTHENRASLEWFILFLIIIAQLCSTTGTSGQLPVQSFYKKKSVTVTFINSCKIFRYETNWKAFY